MPRDKRTLEIPVRIVPLAWHFALLVVILAAGLSCREANQTPAPQAPTEAEPTATPATEPTATPEAEPVKSREERFPTFGVALTPPEGWSADAEQPHSGFLARWTPDNAGPDEWAQFTAQIQPTPEGLTAARAAAVFERRGYERSTVLLGGGSAFRLDAPGNKGPERSTTPSPIIIAKRGERLWRLLFLLDDPADDAVVREVVSNWRWLPTEPAVRHLELGKPQPLFEGLGTVRLPEIARVAPDLMQGSNAAYTAFDYKANQDALVFSFQRFPAVKGDSLDAQTILYAEQIETNTGIESLVNFTPLSGRRSLRVSEVVKGDYLVEGRTVSRLSVYGVWQVDGENFVRMQMVINNEVFPTDDAVAIALKAVITSLATCSTGAGT